MLAMFVLSAMTALSAPASKTNLREITLHPKKTNQKVQIYGSLGVATAISLPDDWVGHPICGDCAFGNAEPKGELWQVTLLRETRTLVVRPIAIPGPDIPESEFLTNLQVALESGLNLTFFIQLVKKDKADFAVALLLPEGASSKERLSQRAKSLEASFAKKLEQALEAKAKDNIMSPVICRDVSNKIKRENGMVVTLSQLCHVGTHLYVTFEVKNRRREPLELGTATLTDPDDNSSSLQRFEKPLLQFNETTRGFASFSSIQPGTTLRKYDLVVAEESGRGRIVEWEGLHFGGWF